MTTDYLSRLEAVLDKLRQLDYRKYRYVIARSETTTIKESCEISGVPASWYYKGLNDLERDELEDLAAELRTVSVLKAKNLISEAADMAARVLIDFAESSPVTAADKKLQFEAAKEILDRAGAIKRTETVVSGAIDHLHGLAVNPQVAAAIDRYWYLEGGDGKPEGFIEGEIVSLAEQAPGGDDSRGAPADNEGSKGGSPVKQHGRDAEGIPVNARTAGKQPGGRRVPGGEVVSE